MLCSHATGMVNIAFHIFQNLLIFQEGKYGFFNFKNKRK